ncbi:PEP/pyruvate-binding domain-containing protein [Pendulispora albinea]|uniref:Pyruvate phosphate dikinase AMP/ATP-binding domain-containing protein n=1 Tax=Pendulispora albinea TaxID=2741071 RepID=A0ABZ2LY99_9BACT
MDVHTTAHVESSAWVGKSLTMDEFDRLSGSLSGIPFVKLVIDRPAGVIHFLDNAKWRFHVEYVAKLLDMPRKELERSLDAVNHSVYDDPDRRFYLAILSRHTRSNGEPGTFFSLETTEADTMDAEMLRYLYGFVRQYVDPSIPLVVKPANHMQESFLREISAEEMPRVLAHELFSRARVIPLNPGMARGRLRLFRSTKEYRDTKAPLEWFDIVVMDRVPDDIPRVSGIINTAQITPLSHVNVLAHGWKIPNAIALDARERIERDGLDGHWVEYRIDPSAGDIHLQRIEVPPQLSQAELPRTHVWIDEPEAFFGNIVGLESLRASDRYQYGTKAANLGELHHLIANGSHRLTGFYQVPRPPRANLIEYLARQLETTPEGVSGAALQLLRKYVRIPRGIVLPFAFQQRFCESSWRIQQVIGKLKMALELTADDQVEPLCLQLQDLIRRTRMPASMRHSIDAAIVAHLAGAEKFVVRSSSNAEDLAGFSAAGIYESITRVSSVETILRSIQEVWASLVSPRSVRLRQQAGISLDAVYMGVIIQQEVSADLGGVLVTTNPTSAGDFRHVYINAARRSVNAVVSGDAAPLQYLYNTMEGGGRTVSLGDSTSDLDDKDKTLLGRLALVGRLLQSHFASNYTFADPIDIEWMAGEDALHILQVRPYSN